MQLSGGRTGLRAASLLAVVAGGLAAIVVPVSAQGRVMGATAPPTAATDDVRPCPVTAEQASTMTGTPMVPVPAYVTPHGGMYVENTPRAPGLEDETTTYTCAYRSEATDGRAYGTPDWQIFLSFALGDSAAWLWGLNGPEIEADPSYVPSVDADPGTVDAYRQTMSFEADGEALIVPRWQVRDRLHSDQLFADVIVSAAGDAQAVHDQVLMVASLVDLAIDESAAP
jgi:hypothetical protein